MNNTNPSHSHTKALQTAHALSSDLAAAAEPAVAADRFAREIGCFLAVFVMRSRRLNGNPLARTMFSLIYRLPHPVPNDMIQSSQYKN
jgi:hypothetical protein